MILAADIGGTKALLALFKEENGALRIFIEKEYSSQEMLSVEELIQKFLHEVSPNGRVEIQSACFSLAGPIHKGFCRLVNLNLTVDLQKLESTLSFIPVISFCNDVAAVAHAVSVLSPPDLYCLTPEVSPPEDIYANKAVVAPGTGLGEALLMAGRYVYPTEGAHTEFGPQSEEEVRLWRFLRKKFGHVSYERLLSGPGLENIYRFLVTEQASGLSTALGLSASKISGQALDNSCPFCIRALDIFTSVLGAECGNLALKCLALGGVYLGGGIPPKILEKLKDGTFTSSFRSKGRFSELMQDIPVYVILNSRAALLGSARLAAEKYKAYSIQYNTSANDL